MKKYVVKKNLSNKDQYILDLVKVNMSNYIRVHRQFLIDLNILVCVNDKGDKK